MDYQISHLDFGFTIKSATQEGRGMSSAKNVQKNMFVKWILIHLPESGVSAENFEEKFASGVLLLELFEALTNSRTHIKVPKTNNKILVIGFISQVLQAIGEHNVKLTISADNIYEKDQTMILGLIWTLILKFHVAQKNEILLWVRDLLPSEDIQNFDLNWRNGDLFCKLVQRLAKINHPIPNDTLSKLQYAFSTSETLLDIQTLLSPGDIIEGHFDERFCLTYLSLFYNKYTNTDSFPLKYEKTGNHTTELEDRNVDLEKLVDTTELGKKGDHTSELEDRIAELEKLVDTKDRRIAQLEKETIHQKTMLEKSESEIHQILQSIRSLTEQLTEQTETNEELQKQLLELQLKLPFLHPKVSNDVPPPSGDNVTLMILDVPEAETFWNTNPNSMAVGLQSLQQNVREIVKANKGFEADIENERITFAFSSTTHALVAAVDIQRTLGELEWPKCFCEEREDLFTGINVSIALCTGTTAFIEGKYSGPAFKLVTRLIAVSRAGEILTTQTTWDQCDTNNEEFAWDDISITDLGEYNVQEFGSPIQILQLFPNSLKERALFYEEFQFLTPEEKKQAELEEKLAALQNDLALLKLKLLATEKEASKARDRALELSAWFKEKREEQSSIEGDKLSELMSEVGTLIRESEDMEIALKVTKKELSGAKKFMNRMNDKIREMSARNVVLSNQLVKSAVEQETLINYIQELEALLKEGEEEEEEGKVENKPKETMLRRLLRIPSRKKQRHEAPIDLFEMGDLRPDISSSKKRKRLQKSKSIPFTRRSQKIEKPQ